jgi:ribosome-binding protein aMBF1 (putative translation factor)
MSTPPIHPDVAAFLANCGGPESTNAITGRSPEEKARRKRIGERVRALRLARGWSLKDLARRTSRNLKPWTVEEIESGYAFCCRGSDREPIYERLAAVLGTTLEALEIP